MNKEEEKGFIKGVAYVIQLYEKEFGTGDFAFNECGITVKEFEEAEVDDYDLNPIKKIANGDGGL